MATFLVSAAFIDAALIRLEALIRVRYFNVDTQKRGAYLRPGAYWRKYDM